MWCTDMLFHIWSRFEGFGAKGTLIRPAKFPLLYLRISTHANKLVESSLPFITVSITLMLLQMGLITEHLGAKITSKSSNRRRRPLFAPDDILTRPQLGRIRWRCWRCRWQTVRRRLVWGGGKRVPGVARVSKSPKVLQRLRHVGRAVWNGSRSET